jgi:hypothetical protein
MELLIIVFFDGGYFFSNASQLSDLIFDLILEEAHFVLEIFDAQIFKHHYLVISVLTQQALEAYRAKVILAEGFDVFCRVDLAPALLELTNLIVVHDIFEFALLL